MEFLKSLVFVAKKVLRQGNQDNANVCKITYIITIKMANSNSNNNDI